MIELDQRVPKIHLCLQRGSGEIGDGRTGKNSIANISWVRAVVLYAILEVVYQIFTQITIGTFDIVAFIIGILVAVLILVLYPNKPALWMQGGMSSGARA